MERVEELRGELDRLQDEFKTKVQNLQDDMEEVERSKKQMEELLKEREMQLEEKEMEVRPSSSLCVCVLLCMRNVFKSHMLLLFLHVS